MSSLQLLDEMSEESLIEELAGRQANRDAGLCDYCNRTVETPPCKFPERHSANANKHVRCYWMLPKDSVPARDMLDAGWDGPGWYFWDETEAYCHGPFGNREEAIETMTKYVEEVLG